MSLIRINIKDLKPGNRLGENIHSVKGILLGEKNQVVDLRLLQILKSFGLPDVSIVLEEEDKAKNVDHEKTKEFRSHVQKQFKNLNLKTPLIEKLFELCVYRGSKTGRGVVTPHTGKP